MTLKAQKLVSLGVAWFKQPLALAFTLVLAALGFAATPALALVAHEYTGQQITEAPPGTALRQPWDMAFDPSGNLFLVDPGTAVVDEFNPGNVFTQQIGGGLVNEASRTVSVDDRTGDLYVSGRIENKPSLLVFAPNGKGGYEHLSTWTNSEFCYCRVYAAVDNSTNPSDVYILNGSTLYVVKPTEGAKKYEVVGTPITVSGGGRQKDVIAVDSATGNVYVPLGQNHAVAVFNDKGEEQPSLAPRGSETPTGSLAAPVAVAVDESTGEVYVVDGEEEGIAGHEYVVDEFSSSGEYEGQIKGTAHGSPFVDPVAVAVQPAGPGKEDVYVSDGAAVDVFGPDIVGKAPVVSGEHASPVTPFSERLEGDVNPGGTETTFFFSWAKGSSCTAKGTPRTAVEHAGSGKASVAESTLAGSLEPSTHYAFCVVAENLFGEVPGAAVPFVTAAAKPEVGSEQAVEVRSSEATLQAKVNPENQQSGYYFEESTAGIGACPLSPAQTGTALPAVYEARGVSVSLSGLPPGTTYDYRVVAYDATGVSCGPVETFSTRPLLLGSSTAGAITQSTATITATIDPGGLHTLYELEVGTSTAYGTPYPGDAGAGSTPTTVTFEVTGLEPGTTYHYRLLAGNGKETEMGPDQTFTTAATVVEVGVELIKPPLELGLVSFTPIAFPTETKGSTTPKALTKAQKLAAALKACKKDKSKKKRAACIKQAHKRYGPVKKK